MFKKSVRKCDFIILFQIHISYMDMSTYGLNIFMPHGVIMFSIKATKYVTKTHAKHRKYPLGLVSSGIQEVPKTKKTVDIVFG